MKANRTAQKWTRREQLGRVAWALALPLFRLSPRPLWSWRRFLLRAFGAKIGPYVHIYPSARVMIPWHITIEEGSAVGDRAYLYSLGPITIGKRVTISQNAHLCAGSHEWRDKTMPLVKPPITVGDDCWICADAFIGPGASVGANAIVGARAVVVKDVPSKAIVGGNPAMVIGQR